MTFKRFGDLQSGDVILGQDGLPVEILQAYEPHVPESLWEIEFEDGAVVKASGNHLWYCETTLDWQLHSERKKVGKRELKKALTPQVVELLERLLVFFNEVVDDEIDPLFRMALIHYQFEKIHPFYDGNGRTGRILNLLYLIQHGLLDLPILYLSRYIVREKSAYLAYLRTDPLDDNWEAWLGFMLRGIELTSTETIEMIHKLRDLMAGTQERIKAQLPKIYSLDLLNTLFKHPYTKIEFVVRDVGVTRVTAASYLDALAEAGFLDKQKIWRSNYYINVPLFKLLQGEHNE